VGALRSFAIAAALACPAPANAGPVERWSGHIAEASARFGIPASWIRRVMRAESGGQVMQHGRPIVSTAGAMGLMQLMPGTWRDMRLALGLGADPHEPHDNILAGSFYLRLMYDRFGYPGLFAAYNAGPARYAAWLFGGRPLPSETQAYVANVARAERAPDLVRGRTMTRPATLFAVAPATAGPPAAAAPLQRSGALFVKLGGSER
jgi:soluble lytic murein transglycosylase-like protein